TAVADRVRLGSAGKGAVAGEALRRGTAAIGHHMRWGSHGSRPSRSRMNIYQEHILPWLIRLAMRNRDLIPYRARTISGASGRVLEIGIGSGLNPPFYPAAVAAVIGLDPSAKLLDFARSGKGAASMPVALVQGS